MDDKARPNRPPLVVAAILSLVLVGVAHAATIQGSDMILGTTNDDTIGAKAGLDSVFGLSGDDRITGGQGDDAIQGDATCPPGASSNFDLCNQSRGTGDDRIQGNAGDDVLAGGAGRDRVSGGSGVDNVNGGRGRDRVNGGAGDDTVYGSSARDTVIGGGGNDQLLSGPGDDMCSPAATGAVTRWTAAWELTPSSPVRTTALPATARSCAGPSAARPPPRPRPRSGEGCGPMRRAPRGARTGRL